jgi:DNA-directed RNA polymerase subunit RPC12/RpoP
MTEKELSEEEKTRDLANTAFYKRSKTPKSQMIMLKLLQANRLDNLRRTNKIAALAYFIEPDSKDLNIDYNIVEKIYTLSNAFVTTKKELHYYQYWRYPIYPIPWRFHIKTETYKKYIDPWMQTYHYYTAFCHNYESLLHKETWVYCPYCKETILVMNQTTRENAIRHVKDQFKKSLKEAKKVLIDKEELKKREEKHSLEGIRYEPPSWEASCIECPKCKDKIILSFKFFKGSNHKDYDPVKSPKLAKKEILVENKKYYDPVIEAKKFREESHYLTQKGYSQLVNSFLEWTEPYVSNIEFEILKLVDPDTLQKYLDLEFKTKKEETGEEEQ